MKTISNFLTLALLLAISTNGYTQTFMADTSGKNRVVDGQHAETERERFVFKSYTSIYDELEAIGDYASHFFGDSVAQKLQAVKDLYISKTDVTVGFGSTHVELRKPVIYNSLMKIEKHLKKEVKKDRFPRAEAERVYSKYLDYVYVIFYEDTEGLEDALTEASGAEEMIDVFNGIRLEN